MVPRILISALLRCLLRPFAIVLLFFKRAFPGRGIPLTPFICAILVVVAFATSKYFIMLLYVRRRRRRHGGAPNSVDNENAIVSPRMSCEFRSSTSPTSSISERSHVAILRAHLSTGSGSSRLQIPNIRIPRPNSPRIFNEHDLPLTSSPVSSFRELFPVQPLPCYFDKLPPELLALIFQFMIPQRLSGGFLDAYVPVLTGRLVCKHWRDIINEYWPLWHSLWPSLKKEHDTKLFKWYQGTVDRIPHLSDITIQLPPDLQYGDQKPTFNTYLYRYLLSLIPKTKAFRFVADGSLSDNDGTSYIFGVDPNRAVSRKLSDGDELPLLRHLHWHSPRFAFAKSFPSQLGVPWSSLRALPWKQFISVTLCLPLTLHDCRLLLDNMDAIEHLSLQTISDSGIDVEYRTTLRVLPYLRYLDLYSEVNVVTLFRHYSMPALSQVELTLSTASGSSDLHRLNLPWPRLKELTIHSKLWQATAVSVIRSLAAIEKLDWTGDLDSDGEWLGMQRLPHLRSLRIKQEAQEFYGSNMARQLVRQVVPHTLVSLDLPFIPEEDTVDSFASLTEVNLHNPISSAQFLLFLSHAKNLRTGTFIITDPPEGNFSPPSSPISFPGISFPIVTPDTFYPSITSNISTLCLRLHLQDTDTQPLFDALSFPHLTSLTINVEKAASSECRGFSDMLIRSRSPISKLILHHAHLDDDTLELCLATISSTLTDLELRRTTGAPRFRSRLFQALTHGSATITSSNGSRGEGVGVDVSGLPCCLCPNLERCHITFPYIDPWFERMISSRLHHDDKQCSRCGNVVKRLKAVGGINLKDAEARLRMLLAKYGVRDSLEFLEPLPFMF